MRELPADTYVGGLKSGDRKPHLGMLRMGTDQPPLPRVCQAVEDTSELYRETGIVPPMALAALAMSAMGEGSSFPGGTVHVSQELEFVDIVRAGDTITCSGRVARRQDRGGLHLMTTELIVTNQDQKKVLSGKVGFILPG